MSSCAPAGLADRSSAATRPTSRGRHSPLRAGRPISAVRPPAPGDNIAAVESIIGAIGAGKVGSLTSFSFYFAGIEGRTLHLYRVEFMDLKEQTRHPILLPLAADNTALLRVRPLYADRSFTLRLRVGADNLLTGVLAK